LKKVIRQIVFVCASLFALATLLGQNPDPLKAQARDMLDKGVLAFKDGNPQLAADSFARALQIDPDLTTAELYLGMTYASMYTPQNPEAGKKAIESLQRVLEKQPNNQEAVMRLGALFHSIDPRKARDLYLNLTKSSPQDPVAFYSLGAVNWTLAFNKTNPPPDGERLVLVDEGLRSLDVALTLNPQYEDAMVYKNLLLRQKAELTPDATERARLVDEADRLFVRALDLRRQNQRAAQAPAAGAAAAAPPPLPSPPPPQPPAQRIGGNVAQSNLVSNTVPVYPPLARAARIQGVVLLQTFISKTGQVTDVSVLSGHPLLNEAAMDAVRQWQYRPTLLNGQPIDVVTTVSVNFSMQ
jgi:TonB family protein